jgi:RHS repeat-associated protein
MWFFQAVGGANRLLVLILFAAIGWWFCQPVEARQFGLGDANGSGLAGGGNADSLPNSQVKPIPEVGPDHRKKSWVRKYRDSEGNTLYETNSFVQIATGLNRLNSNGEWEETSDEVELVPGRALVRKLRYQGSFSANLRDTGAFQVTAPDGENISWNPVGLSYYDPVSGNSVMIAEIRDTVGAVSGTNQIVYLNAFDGIKADIVLRVSRFGVEQDVVLSEQPPSPELWGLSSRYCRLEVVSEFHSSRPRQVKSVDAHPQETDPATRSRMVEPDLVDDQIDFGAMTIGHGSAFRTGSADRQPHPVLERSQVFKRFNRTSDGRTLLFESMPLSGITNWFSRLPAGRDRLGTTNNFVPKGSGSIWPVRPAGAEGLRRLASAAEETVPLLPAWRGVPWHPKALSTGAESASVQSEAHSEITRIDYHPSGVVVDFPLTLGGVVTLGSNTVQDFTFAGDTTYHLMGEFVVNGTAFLEGGCVVKSRALNYLPFYNDRVSVELKGPVVCKTTPYRPMVFTAEDDASIGMSVTTNSVDPNANWYGNACLTIQNPPQPTVVENLVFKYCLAGLNYYRDSTVTNFAIPHIARNIQVYNYGWGPSASAVNLLLENALVFIDRATISNAWPRPAFIGAGGGQISAVNATVHNIDWLFLNFDSNPSNSLILTNCLLVGTNLSWINYPGGSSNQIVLDTGTIFQKSGYGAHYLPVGSPYSKSGTAAVSAELRGILRTTTTAAPTEITSDFTASATILTTNVIRDSGASPDLGYHYPPIDWFLSNRSISSGSSVIMTNGVVLAFYGTKGFTGTGQVSSLGSPTIYNRLTTLSTVQELPPVITNAFTLFNAPVTLRFTDVSMLVSADAKRRLFSDPLTGTVIVRDSTLRGVNWQATGSGGGVAVELINSIVERSSVNWAQNPVNTSPLAVGVENTLFTFSTVNWYHTAAQYGEWIVYDNLFDNDVLTFSQAGSPPEPLRIGYNGFINTANITNSYGSIQNLDRDFVNGPLGAYYYPTIGGSNSLARLINGDPCRIGSTACLYYYTTTTNQAIEGNTPMDIGFHYVALTNGAPLDVANTNGVPDFLENLPNTCNCALPLSCFASSPSVSISSPIGGQVFPCGTTSMTLTASACESDRPVNVTYRRIFPLPAVNLGSGAFPNYAFTWNALTPGTNTVVAIASDSLARSVTSAPVSFTIAGPAVVLTAPTNSQVFPGSPTNIVLTVATSDTTSLVTNVEYYANGLPIGSNAVPPYSLVWGQVAAGTYSIVAKVYDAAGCSSQSPALSITVNGLPGVMILQPTNTTVFPPASPVTFIVRASSSYGAISNVSLFVGTNITPVGVATAVSTNYQVTLSNLASGKYAVYAQATDAARGVARSPLCVFEINDFSNLPTISLTAPTGGASFPVGGAVIVRANSVSTANTASVGFFDGAQSLGSDTTSPYSLPIVWTTPGIHTLTACATNLSGKAVVSSPVTVIVTNLVDDMPAGYWETFDIAAGSLVTPYPEFRSLQYNRDDGLLYSAVQSLGSTAAVRGPATKAEGFSWVNTVVDPRTATALCKVPGFLFFAGSTDYGWYSNSVWTKSGDLDGAIWFAREQSGDVLFGGPAHLTDPSNYHVWKMDGTTHAVTTYGPALGGPPRAVLTIGATNYIAGEFLTADGASTPYLIQSTPGGGWTGIGRALDGPVWALAAWGNKLVAGGAFTRAGTNANLGGIAIWDGQSWSTVEAGVSGAPNPWGPSGPLDPDSLFIPPTPGISSLIVRGNRLYAAGRFLQANNREGYIISTNVAEAVWLPQAGRWQWRSMDGGVGFKEFNPGTDNFYSYVHQMALVEHGGSNAFDLVVGGHFSAAGARDAFNVARWQVGQADTRGPVPNVQLLAPRNQTSVPLSPVTLTASVTVSDTNVYSISKVAFFVDGQFIDSTSATDVNTNYTVTWSNPTAGWHEAWAIATQTANAADPSHPTVASFSSPHATFFGSASAVTPLSFQATVDNYVPSTNLYVIGNPPVPSTNVITGILRFDSISGVLGATPPSPKGNVSIAADGHSLLYRPFPGAAGRDLFYYQTSQGSQGSADIMVLDHPRISIAYPTNNQSYPAPGVIAISGTVTDVSTNVVSVRLYANGFLAGTSANSSFSLSTNVNLSGWYDLSVVATDANGLMATNTVSVSVKRNGANVQPVAAISSLAISTTNITGFTATNYPVLRDGQVVISGSAYDPDSVDPVSYSLQLFRPGDSTQPVLQLTPSPADASGFFSGSVNNAALATANLDRVPNGVYDLVLTVRGGSDAVATAVRFSLESQMRVGQLTFSEQDAVLPVAGVPLTVVRTYDSYNPDSRDFGYGWTYSLVDLDVQMDEQRSLVTPFAAIDGSDANDFNDQGVSVRTGGGYNVTLNLPGGRRTTFLFSPAINGTDGSLMARWTSAPGVTATLTMDGDNIINPFVTINGFPTWHVASETPFQNFDIPAFTLKLLDGTTYHLQRDAVGSPAPTYAWDTTGLGNWVYVQPHSGPYHVVEIDRPVGESIRLMPNRIDHYRVDQVLDRSLVFTPDPQNPGRIGTLQDPAGGAFPLVQYNYDGLGNLARVLRLVDRTSGTYSTNSYFYEDPRFPHYLTAIQSAAGISRSYYDSNGRLAAVVDALGNTNQFQHDLANRQETTIDRLGRTSITAYDTQGNVVSVTSAYQTPVQQLTTFGYDDLGNQISAVDPLGVVTRTGYDANNLPRAVTNAFGTPLQTVTTFTYDSYGNPLVTTDPRGNWTSNTYDLAKPGLLLTVANVLGGVVTNEYYPATGLMSTTRDAVGTGSQFYYDAYGNLTSTVAGYYSDPTTFVPQSTNTAVFDSVGNQTNRIDPNGVITTTIYDAQNRVTGTIAARGTPDQSSTSTVYDGAGRVALTVDPRNNITAFGYDPLGRRTSVTNAFGTPSQTVTSYSFDAQGNMTNTVDPLQRVTLTLYDPLNRATTVIAAAGTADAATNRSIYDASGLLTMTVDARGNTNQYGYDALGRRTSTILGLGTAIQQTTTYGYDANGNQTNITDSASNTVQYTFDALNRPFQTILPAVTVGGSTFVSSIGYDAAGHRVWETNAAGIITRFGYDRMGRLAAVTNGLGSGTATNWATYAYDANGNQTNQVSALGQTVSYEYDNLGRRKKRILPGTQATSYTYDPAGNQLTQTTADNVTISQTYDPFNRLKTRSQGSTNLETYTYTATGRLSTRTDGSGSYSWTYDARDRVKTNTTPVGMLYYSYDGMGNLTGLGSGTAGGVTNGYTYDALNRLQAVTDQRAGGITRYTYDAVGNLKTTSYPTTAATVATWSYDTQNRLTNLNWTAGAANLAGFGYLLNSLGSRTQLTETVGGLGRTYVWGYDALQRLTNETITGTAPTGSLGYTYDRVGNRLFRTGGIGSVGAQSATYDSNDWINTGGTTYFDAKGNNISFGGNFAYDWANRMTGAGTVLMTYDADGNRLKKVNGTATTRYLVAMVNPTGYPQVVEEYTGSSSPTLSRVYNYGLDLISQNQGGGLTYYGYDGLGSTRFLLNTAGAINGSGGNYDIYSYDAYGNLLTPMGPTANSYLYTGEQFDADLGLYYLRARFLSPSLGRFQSMDSFEGSKGELLSRHQYIYCHANPVNGTDPSGHEFTYVGTITTLTTAEGLQGMKGGIETKVQWEMRDMVKQMTNDLMPNDLNQTLGQEGEDVWVRYLNSVPGFRTMRAKGSVSAVGPDVYGVVVKNGKIVLFIGEVKASEGRLPGVGRLKWNIINAERQMSAGWLDRYASQVLEGMIDLGLQGLGDVDELKRYIKQGQVEAYLLGGLKEWMDWRIRGFRLMHLGNDEVLPDISEGGFPEITDEHVTR